MPIAPEFLHLAYPDQEFPAYLYGRASRDPKRKGRSVKSQLEEGRTLCLDNNWPIAGEFKDVDRSASAYARRKRDEFEEMIEGIEKGECRILVAFEASRYYRDLEAYVRLRRVCKETGVLLCYNGEVYDLSKGADRKATARDAVAAEGEADDIRERNLRTTRQNAKRGGVHGPVPDGYKRRYDPDSGDLIDQVPHPERAALITEIFQRAAAAEPLAAICRDLNERGETTHRGKPWARHHLHAILRNPAYIGHRRHLGVDTGKGLWAPICDDKDFPETFRTVQEILALPGRQLSPGPQARHLQTSIALCGECPEEPPLRSVTIRGRTNYNCSARYDVALREDRMDAYVEESVITWLSSERAVAAFDDAGDDEKARRARIRLKALEGQLKDARKKARTLREDGKGMLLSIDSLAELEAELTPQIEKARTASQPAHVPEILRELIGKPRPDVDRAWNLKLTLPQRRMILRLVVTVRLFKASRRGVRTIEPGRITLSFFGEPGFKPAARSRA
ncbi:recombinase family protein [Streptomyces sp. TRM68416]|uniref:recombinase family protein n=1 Tax=Streptomyces sp. TRM68416 TaxID=2758412 RepID=UPI001661E1BD|nr:recombinase family protein [Streptomyces sp. TRM68416]MBD0837406.1 recombinase family protein [Streptomyces sp. TRM68416]